MLPSRGFLRSRQSLGLARAAPSPTRRATRQFGTALRNNGISLRGTFNTTPLLSGRIGGPLAITAASHQILSSLRQARYASTQQPLAGSQPPADSLPGTSPESFSPGTIDLEGFNLWDIPEQAGFLKAMGLDYGWGPSSVVQWTMENIYLLTGMPWWATMTVMALLTKAAVFHATLGAQIESQKMKELRKHPRYNTALNTMKESMISGGDKQLAMAARLEVSKMNQAAGFKYWKTIMPLLNIPITFGVFRVFRGMSSIPVPSLETGGALWFTDLSIPDPYFVMPICTAYLLWRVMGTAIGDMDPQQAKTMKVVKFIMVPVSLVFTLFIPSGIQLYFFITALLQGAQNWVFKQPACRKFLGLPTTKTEPPKPNYTLGSWQAPRTLDTTARQLNETPSASSTSAYSSLMGGLGTAKEKITEMSAKRAKQAAATAAKELQEKRALEEKEQMIARREEKLMKRRGQQ